MKIYRNLVFFLTLLAFSMPLSVSADSVTLYAAGSFATLSGNEKNQPDTCMLPQSDASEIV